MHVRTVAQSFRGGELSVFLTLALSLVVPFGGVGLVWGISLINLIAGGMRGVADAARLYFTDWTRSDAFKANLLILAVTLVEFFLLIYHRDELGEFETQAKQYLTALAILLTIRRFPVDAVIWGAAAGSLLAGIVALSDLLLLDLPRAEGPTNPIRFGIIAALMATYCWSGVMFGQMSRAARLVLAAASASGFMAVVASGSRGSVAAIPFILLPLLPRLWRGSRSTAFVAASAFVVAALVLGLWQVSTMRGGVQGTIAVAQSAISGEAVGEESTRDRLEMLDLASGLFTQHPWVGVGSVGWNKAVEEEMKNDGADQGLDRAFNQPHNQYANDLAKGGLLRGLCGLAMLVFPFYVFLKHDPFGSGERSLAALLGIVTCVAFAVFGLIDSVMDLSITASLYATLLFYLLGAAEGAPLDALKTREPDVRA